MWAEQGNRINPFAMVPRFVMVHCLTYLTLSVIFLRPAEFLLFRSFAVEHDVMRLFKHFSHIGPFLFLGIAPPRETAIENLKNRQNFSNIKQNGNKKRRLFRRRSLLLISALVPKVFKIHGHSMHNVGIFNDDTHRLFAVHRNHGNLVAVNKVGSPAQLEVTW